MGGRGKGKDAGGKATVRKNTIKHLITFTFFSKCNLMAFTVVSKGVFITVSALERKFLVRISSSVTMGEIRMSLKY